MRDRGRWCYNCRRTASPPAGTRAMPFGGAEGRILHTKMGGLFVMRAIGFVSALCLAGLLMPLNQARAVVIVVGGGAATECYATAEYGDPNKAFDICTRALSDQNLSVRDRAATYVNRSVVRLRVRDYAGALGDVDLCIARQPSLSEAYVNRGAALLNLDRAGDAVKD